MITIDELMTVKPYTLTEENSLEDARRIMTEKHIRHIPVTDDNNKLLGLVTQRDVLEASHPDTDNTNIKIADIMIRDVSVIHQSSSVRQAAIFLKSHKYGCLPVVSDHRLIGIITDTDFIDIAINLLEQIEITEDSIDDIDYETDDLNDIDLPTLDEDL